MSTPPTSPNSEQNRLSSEALAAAALRRASQNPTQKSAAQLAAEHDRRQDFRRCIDPGIIRPNSKEQAASSLKTLLTIAENLLKEPDNQKYQQFKSTNSIIQRDLMDPKGAIEYAIEMGFRPMVKDFQPYYKFNPKHMGDLRMGAAILRDRITLENEKTERAVRAKANEKANIQAAAERVKLAYIDDRKTKELKDDMEREQRAARAARAGSTQPTISPTPPTTLLGRSAAVDAPPPYNDSDDEEFL